MKKQLIEFLEQFVLPPRKLLLEKNLQLRTGYITIVLEDLYQQHNASAVVRSCDSFGIQSLHVIEKRNKFIINKEIAVGSESWVDIIRYNQHENNSLAALQNLKQQGYRIVTTSLHEQATKLEDFDLAKGKAAIVFGTELTGISEDVKNMTDEFLYIPMYGFAESLNISVSAAIILHYLSDKLRKSDLNWKLSDEEMLELKIKWLKNSIKNPEMLEKYFYEKLKNNS